MMAFNEVQSIASVSIMRNMRADSPSNSIAEWMIERLFLFVVFKINLQLQVRTLTHLS